jgi:hypothetical protein
LERALRNMEGAERSFPEIDWERLRGSLEPWRKDLAEVRKRNEGSRPLELPKVLLRHKAR